MNFRLPLQVSPACLATTAFFLLPCGPVTAADSFWNPGGTGGDGNWGTSPGEKNWNTTAGGTPGSNTFWQDGVDETAVFQDTLGGIVTVIDTVQTTGIRQTGAGYTLNAGTILLAPGSGLEAPFIDVQAGTLTIDSQLDGGAGLVKTGAGTLQLTRDSTFTGLTTVAGGRLVLASELAGTELRIAAGAELVVQSGGLRDDLDLFNSGRVTLNVVDIVSTYQSTGGVLAATSSRLTADEAELNDRSIVSGTLWSGSVTTDGGVTLDGRLESSMIDVRSGILDNTGILDASAGRLNLRAGAVLVAGGNQQFGELTTSGSGAGTWRGNLANPTLVAPGGDGGRGELRVEGDFANLPSGILSLEAGSAGADLLAVTGLARFDGTLELKQLGADLPAGLRIQIVQAGSYAGNFDILSEDLAGAVLFNPLDGSITRLEFGEGAFSPGRLTPNQASTWAALYEDVIDPGIRNVIPLPGLAPPFTVTSGIASGDDPDLLWALGASITPAGFDRGLLSRLSPEAYAGLSDYAVQATRAHRRSAFEAPALARGATSTGSKDAKGASVASGHSTLHWEVFAAADYIDGGTSGSWDGADYSLSGSGSVAGVRLSIGSRARVAAYLAGDSGEIRGGRIDADGRGGASGILGDWILEESKALRLSGGISYGSFSFDGTRGSASATAAGWAPGLAGFSDVDSEALDIFLALDAVAWRDERFMLMPSIGLNYTTADTDPFREFGRAAPGSPITLTVDRSRRESLISEISLGARAEVAERVILDGGAGFHLAIDDDPERVSARFNAGGRPLAATVNPLANDLFFIGLGATWTAAEAVQVRIGYRAEFRSDAETLNALHLGATFGF
jgi:autotransporter-associated beta strand protein